MVRPCAKAGCFKQSSYDVAGSSGMKLCATHARAGMVDVRRKRCSKEGCSKWPSFGITGTKKREFCAQHARTGMVDVTGKKCGNDGCSTRPSYGGADSKRAEFCAQHAREGMVNIMTKKCRKEGCPKMPSYGLAGSRGARFCTQHARAGMVNVVDKKCRKQGCSKHPSYGVAGTRKGEFCAQHARAGMMYVRNKKCGIDGCSKQVRYDVNGAGRGKLCRKHAAEEMPHVSTTTEFARAVDNSNHGETKGRVGCVVDRQVTTRKHPAGAGCGANGVDYRRSLRSSARRGGTTPPLVSGQAAAGIGEVSVETEADVKLEMAIAPPARAGGGLRMHSELATLSSDGRTIGGGSYNSGRAKRVRRMTPLVSGQHMAVDEEVAAESEADVKLELAVSASSH